MAGLIHTLLLLALLAGVTACADERRLSSEAPSDPGYRDALEEQEEVEEELR